MVTAVGKTNDGRRQIWWIPPNMVAEKRISSGMNQDGDPEK